MIEFFTSLWNSLPENLRQNEFFSGGAILAIIGLLGNQVRHWVAPVWSHIKAQFILEISVTNDDLVFEWLKNWLDQQPSMNRIRSVEVSIRQNEDRGYPQPARAGIGVGAPQEADTRPQFVVTPGVGTHFLWFCNRLVWMTRSRQDNAPVAGGNVVSFLSGKSKETITMKFFTRDRELIQRLFNAVRDFNVPPHEPKMHIYSYRCNYAGWKCVASRKRSDHRNVILPDGVLETIESDIREFRRSRAWYEDKGIPWRRGYLFHGQPGSGKTSAAIELALRTGQDLAVLPMASEYFDDTTLLNAISEMPSNCILLFEDVDCLFRKREGDKENSVGKSGVTFSGFLNAIDGVLSTDGTVTIMSTNHPETLDAALMRPGRVDMKQEFGFATRDQAQRMFAHFFPGSNGMSEKFASALDGASVSMCSIQEHLVRHRGRPELALESYKTLTVVRN